MKLRIQNDSLRIRLTQTEVSHLKTQGQCIETIHFPSGNGLQYIVESGDQVECDFADNKIFVKLMTDDIAKWADGDQVGISQDVSLENDKILSILVEKDFKCLTRDPEEERDMYPNPNASHS